MNYSYCSTINRFIVNVQIIEITTIKLNYIYIYYDAEAVHYVWKN